MSEQGSGMDFLAGLVAGGLIGAAVALLIAPQSGEETRAQLREKSEELKNTASESIADSRVKADAIIADARTRAENIMADARTKAEEIQVQAKERATDLQAKGKATLETQSEKFKEITAKITKHAEDAGLPEA